MMNKIKKLYSILDNAKDLRILSKSKENQNTITPIESSYYIANGLEYTFMNNKLIEYKEEK